MEYGAVRGRDQGRRRRDGQRLSILRRIDAAAEALALLGGALLILATCVWIVDIVGRQTVGYSVLGLEDITQLLVMGFIAFALPVTFLREGNISVDFVVEVLPLRVRAVLQAVIGLLAAAFVGALAWFAAIQAAAQFAQGAPSATLAIPMVYYWIPLLLGIGLSALACALLAARSLAALTHGR